MMNWREKLQKTKQALSQKPELEMYFSESPGAAPEQFLRKLRSRFPRLDPEYEEFLRTENGLRIDWNVLFGSGQDGSTSLEQAESAWNGIIDLSQFIIIGEDCSGCCFALNRGGRCGGLIMIRLTLILR
jgi:hypothetical protein